MVWNNLCLKTFTFNSFIKTFMQKPLRHKLWSHETSSLSVYDSSGLISPRQRNWSWSSRKLPPSLSVRSPATRDRSSEKSSTRSTSFCRDGRSCLGGNRCPPHNIRRVSSLPATNWLRSLWWVCAQNDWFDTEVCFLVVVFFWSNALLI